MLRNSLPDMERPGSLPVFTGVLPGTVLKQSADPDLTREILSMEAELEKMRDEELVIRARENDPYAEDLIFERYRQRVSFLAEQYHVRGADPEDLFQEGMIGLFKAIQSYDPSRREKAAFFTFASLCIERQIRSAVRNASCQKHMLLNNSISLACPMGGGDGTEYLTLEENIGDREDDPQKKLLIHEDVRLIEEGTRCLSDLEGKVWKLYAEGLSYKEIAARLGITEKAVDNAVRRAKGKLLALLRQS